MQYKILGLEFFSFSTHFTIKTFSYTSHKENCQCFAGEDNNKGNIQILQTNEFHVCYNTLTIIVALAPRRTAYFIISAQRSKTCNNWIACFDMGR